MKFWKVAVGRCHGNALEGEENTKLAIEKGAKVVQSPNAHLYFDHYQSKRPNQPLAIGGFTNLKEVYDYEPVPSGLTPIQQQLIVGAQANVWTRYMSTFNQVEYMIFPRILALSEVLWSKTEKRYLRICGKINRISNPRLESKGINYSKAMFETEFELNNAKNGYNGIAMGISAQIPGSVYEISGLEKETIKSGAVMDGNHLIPASKLSKELNLKVHVSKDNKPIDLLEVNIQSHAFLGKKWKMSETPSEYYKGNK